MNSQDKRDKDKRQEKSSIVQIQTQKSILSALLLIFVLCCCQSKTKQTTSLSGNWICQNAADSVLKYQSFVNSPLPPFELVFWEGRDSLLYLNPFEAALFPFKSVSDKQVSFTGFVDAKLASTLTFQTDSTMTMDNPPFQFTKLPSAWCKPSMMKGWETGLESYFYRTLLAGVYQVEQTNLPKTLSDSVIVFADDQSVTGTLRSNRCQLIMGGDEAEADTDIFHLWNTDSTYSQYGWKLSGKQLTVYSMKNASAADEKPFYERDKMLLVLRKK